MPVAILVEAAHAHHLRQKIPHGFLRDRVIHGGDIFIKPERTAGVSRSGRDNHRKCRVGNRNFPSRFRFQKRRPSEHRPFQLRRTDGFEFKHRAARHDRRINVKIRIFRRGSDKRDSAVFYIFQKRLLLLFIEILHLVKIQQNAVRSEQRRAFRNHVFHVGKPCACRVELVQRFSGSLRQNIGRSRLPRAGGTEKYHIGDMTGVQHLWENSIRPEKLRISHHIFKGFRPYSVCKGLFQHIDSFFIKRRFQALFVEFYTLVSNNL